MYLTDFLLCYEGEAEIVREPRRMHPKLNQDAEMAFQQTGRFFNIELDTGSEDLGTIEGKFKAYRRTQDFLLVVTLSERTLRNLMERAESVEEIVLFAVLDDVLDDPHGKVYRDCFGNTASL